MEETDDKAEILDDFGIMDNATRRSEMMIVASKIPQKN
jgi:hypothetical protein